MAESERAADVPATSEDHEMGDAEAGNEAAATSLADESGLADIQPDSPAARTTFLDYLRSPIIHLSIGSGDKPTLLTAHQALLVKSPFFAEKCADFDESTEVRRIELPDEDIDAVGSFLEYLYKGEYFPRRTGEAKDSPLETDPSMPSPDDTGAALLRHARVYTLANKFGIPALKSLAHSKIHRTPSTAKGEIAYARFVYKETTKEDNTLRRPIAAFWASESHTLRHRAENEFKLMCLEFPEFAFDVLSLVLDQKEKREPVIQPGPPSSARKRARQI